MPPLILTETNLIRTEAPTNESPILVVSIKSILKHILIVNDNSHSTNIKIKIGALNSELPFLSEIKISKRGLFQWEGWDVLEIGDRILVESERSQTYIHIAGATLV